MVDDNLHLVLPQILGVVAGGELVDDEDELADEDDEEVEEDDDEEPPVADAAALKHVVTPKVPVGADGQPLQTADAEAMSEFKEHIEDLIKTRSDRLEESAKEEEKIRLGEAGWKAR